MHRVPDAYEQYGPLLEVGHCIFVEGSLQERNGDRPKLLAERLFPIDAVPELFTKELHVHLYEASTHEETLRNAREVLMGQPGDTPVIFRVVCAGGEIAFLEPAKLKVRNTEGLRAQLVDLLGEDAVTQRANRDRPEPRRRRRGPPQRAA